MKKLLPLLLFVTGCHEGVSFISQAEAARRARPRRAAVPMRSASAWPSTPTEAIDRHGTPSFAYEGQDANCGTDWAGATDTDAPTALDFSTAMLCNQATTFVTEDALPARLVGEGVVRQVDGNVGMRALNVTPTTTLQTRIENGDPVWCRILGQQNSKNSGDWLIAWRGGSGNLWAMRESSGGYQLTATGGTSHTHTVTAGTGAILLDWTFDGDGGPAGVSTSEICVNGTCDVFNGGGAIAPVITDSSADWGLAGDRTAAFTPDFTFIGVWCYDSPPADLEAEHDTDAALLGII